MNPRKTVLMSLARIRVYRRLRKKRFLSAFVTDLKAMLLFVYRDPNGFCHRYDVLEGIDERWTFAG